MENHLNFDDIALEYETWYYTPKGKYFAKLEKDAIFEAMKPKKGNTLLDIGCGTGYFSYYFHSLGLRVTGIDSSQKMLNVAKNKGENIEFVQSDAHKLNYQDNSFDITTMITSLEFCQKPEDVIREAYRVTKEKLIMVVLNKFSWLNIERMFKRTSIYKKAKFYSPWELKRLINNTLHNSDFKIKSPLSAFLLCKIEKKIDYPPV
jgi:ubiquinone/menaquinone biosynthesis C-methylase UbiE